jgi:uncharacterized delta-60 repeat protein
MKIILPVLCCLIISEISNAQQPGTLDNSFGDSGKVISKNFGNCYAMVVQADNKIVCLGDTGIIGVESMRLVHYLPDGTLDSAFARNGILDPVLPETNISPTSITIQPDQKIIAAGSGYKNGVPTMVLIRVMPDGSYDQSFGTNGIVDSTFGIGESFPYIALQPDGKIVVLGWYYPGFILVRYNTDGTLDKSFGNNGEVLTTFGEGTVPSAIAITPDGKIVAAGNYGGGVGYSKFLLSRYNTDGTLDQTFGHSGVITTDFGKYGDEIHSIAIQPDDKIVAVGVTGVRAAGDVENMAIARYNTDGSLDMNFGIQGETTIIFPDVNSKVNGVVIENDGEILLGGSTYQKIYYGDLDFIVSELDSNGILDSSFGTNGITVTDFGSYDGAQAIALQGNKIILAGTSSINGETPEISYALARYYNDSLSKKQIIITKIRRWLQQHNGIEWDNTGSINSYAVQRSADGINWTTVYRSPLTVHTYSDPSPLNSTNYYRLQTTSTSNAVTNSNVIAISNDDDIKVSPNPAQSLLHIEGLSFNQQTKIRVVDFNGNVKLQFVANASSYNLNIASLHAGNYMLKIETNGEVVTKQFVKE